MQTYPITRRKTGFLIILCQSHCFTLVFTVISESKMAINFLLHLIAFLFFKSKSLCGKSSYLVKAFSVLTPILKPSPKSPGGLFMLLCNYYILFIISSF